MIGPALAFAALAWLALLLITPTGPTWLATLIYSVGSFICHQRPERSFHLGASQLPVCARCLGIYAGFAVAACVQVLFSSARWRRVTPAVARGVFVVGAIPTAITLALEWSGVWRGSNDIRAIAGVVLGAVVALVVMSVVATLHYSGCERRRPTESSPLPPPI